MAKRDRRQGKPDSRPETRKVERRQGDRRRSTRVPVSLWVDESTGEELYFQQAGNISEGGVFFERTIPHPPGTRVNLKFELPDDLGIIETEGEVVNVPADPDGLGAGVKFINLDPVEERIIRQFIARKAGKEKK